jgi:Cd(II)/Pb(II)-responsive transcriptional regulator
MSIRLKIGELAKRTGTLPETIRYYEREGLLTGSARTAGNYRLYTEVHLERLQFIRHCRSLDMTLEEIRTLLSFRDAPDENCSQVNLLLDEHIKHVYNRIEELKLLEQNLRRLRSLCRRTQAAKDCAILQSLGTSPRSPLRDSNLKQDNSRLHKTHQRSATNRRAAGAPKNS